MRIAIDASRTTTAQRTGTENYALQLIRAMLSQNTPHEFHLYFRDEPKPDLFPSQKNVKLHVIPLRRTWTHARFATALWMSRPDVTFVPSHTLPLNFPGPAVVTVHDLGYIYFPNAHPGFSRRYLEWSTRHSVERATRVIADSLATVSDLAAHYQVSENKMTLVYPGVDESLERVTDPAKQAFMRARYHLPERYFLFIGTLQPRKNIARIVQAYAKWRTRQSKPDIGLVIAGPQGWLYDPKWTTGVEGLVLPGYIQDEDIAALYSGAEALLFPTLHEGFGFPVLESMRCGTPVITSNTSSLPEVAGEAALLVNPRDVDAITNAIECIVTEKNIREDLIAKGYEQVKRFTWKRSAEQTIQVLERATKK
jgi:glycosyltransferase involved in cell wall biosynthesis